MSKPREKTDQRRDELLRRALVTPPISNEEIVRRQSQQPGHIPRGPKKKG